MKLNKKTRSKAVGLSSFFALLAVSGIAVACPFSGGTQVSAANNSQTLSIDFYLANGSTTVNFKNLTIDFFLENGNSSYQQMFKMLGIDFYLKGAASLGLDNLTDIKAEVNPLSETNGFVTKSLSNLTAWTNDGTGLSAYVFSANGKTDLENGDKKIATLDKTYTEANFPLDKWGYSLKGTGITEGTGIQINNAIKTDKTYTGLKSVQDQANPDCALTGNGKMNMELSFAAKVGMDVEPGDYSQTVSVMVSNPAKDVAELTAAMQTVERTAAKVVKAHPEAAAQYVESRNAAAAERGEDLGEASEVEIAAAIMQAMRNGVDY